MRYLYKGKTKIGKIHMKTKVDTSFITAGPEDIAAGKKTINGNYEEITGTMDVNAVLTELTSDATATAADITAGKIGYANGKRLVGTTVRDISTLLMPNQVVDDYKVDNAANVSIGDFVTITEKATGTNQHTPGTTQFINLQNTTALTYVNIINLTDNINLLIYFDAVNIKLVCRFVYINGLNLDTTSNLITFDVGTITQHLSAIKMTDNKILLSFGLTNNSSVCRMLTINDSYTNITSTDSFAYNVNNLLVISSKLAKLTDNKAILCYIKGTNRELYAHIVTYSNNQLQFSTAILINSGPVQIIRMIDLLPDRCIIAYTADYIGHVRTLQINNNEIIIGTDYSFGYWTTSYMEIVKLSQYKFMIIYTNSQLSNTAAVIGYYNNGIKLSNTGLRFRDIFLPLLYPVAISHNKIVTFYTDSPGNRLSCFVTNISANDTFTNGEVLNFSYVSPTYMVMGKTGEDRVMVALTVINQVNNTYNFSGLSLLQINGMSVSHNFNQNITKTEYVVNKHVSGGRIDGIANESGSSGDNIKVILPLITS